MNTIDAGDRLILREVARKQLEYAHAPHMSLLREEWKRHNDCKAGRPMAVIEWGTFSQEVIPPLMHCKGAEARDVEWALYRNFVGQMLFADDSVVDAFMPVRPSTWFKAFDIDIKVEKPQNEESLGHRFREVITDLEEDFHKLGKSTFGVNHEADKARIALYEDIFGDILPAKMVGSGLYAVPTQKIVHLMSMETMLFSLYDYPELFHEMMERLTEDYLCYFRFLEQENILLPTTENEPVGNGTFAFTNELPSRRGDAPLLSKDVWGFMDSQETTGISPEMFETFMLPYYKRIADSYGLLSYGCCEAVDPIWENCLSKLQTLRKISISPWCNEEYMGEALAGKKIVYHRKPSPNYLGVDRNLDVDGLTKCIKKTLRAAKDCPLEFTQRDVYTVHNDMDKVRQYMGVMRRVSS